ncbi:hypothetical protein D8Y22_13705 [Salinadaptatus halalkaliphilus]|uniref:DUF8112 domain-containing protein n=1 Tax=Salinadaptatus halalkaliphilus TaxID=2419781 RepID=A0A4S3TJP9_9EURY|nr:hypothetical protein [Salinadaptatus halalkaliphilus]THE64282.1 hypothetical protein D8Y22_13705 [Salinadaptatus halalkaliphilus]
MEKSNPSKQETVDDQLIEDISQLEGFALGEGAAVCEVCGEKLREGAPIVAFAFRPVDQPAFEIGHVKCIDCRHEPTEFFTLGVRELILEGRIGTCSDPATQSSWPVLLAPQPRAVSPADATTVHPLPGSTWFRRPIARSDVFAAADYESTRKPWQRPVVRADNANLDSTSEPESDSTSDETAETTAPHAADGGRRGEVQ